MKFFIPTEKLFKAFLVAIFLLLLLNFLSIFLAINHDGSNTLESFIIRLFDFNQEANIPSFFSSLQFLTASILLLVITIYKKTSGKKYIGWLGMTLLFFLLMVDEAVSIHEFLLGFLVEKYNSSTLFYYVSLFAFGLVLLGIVLIYIPFFNHLNRKLLFSMLLSAGVFLLGAIVFETIGNNTLDTDGLSFGYRLIYTIEETLEMLGLAIFINTLNWYVAIKMQKISVVLTL
ncbi:hypothetical protein [uncultured Cyclobacterium sp.]|uniref:hypothetical protein n=1 Tax=uncultured Cyclobacterium sp. TaxID=453820 RepID=UPI0030EDE7D4|tara:strand:- start:46373 stop:47065 length:693 start_codon:yes stop_codon:yes gene_type:complete